MSADDRRGKARSRLRSEVALAGGILSANWPLSTFIAVNPLGGLEDRPFEEALEVAGRLLGARGVLDEATFRSLYAAGRISESDLRAALARRHPHALALPGLHVDGRDLGPEDVLLVDLLHGQPAPPAGRSPRTMAEWCDALLGTRLAEAVDAQTAKWCAAFLDAGQAAWTMPGRQAGLYAAWRRLAAHDRALSRAARRRVRELPDHPEDVILAAIEGLGVGEAERRAYLQGHLAQLPGWASHVRWRAEHGTGIDLVAYLALRLFYEHEFVSATIAPEQLRERIPVHDDSAPREPSPSARLGRICDVLGAPVAELTAAATDRGLEILEALPVRARALVWLEAYECHYADRLLGMLERKPPAPPVDRPAAQAVFCIDARSEGLRRHLEQTGPYETLGFAGFFAVAVRFRDLAGGAASALCPVLLEPRNEVAERPAPAAGPAAERNLAGRQALAAAEDAFHRAKDDFVAPFALAEASGWVVGPLAAAKTLAPRAYGALRARLARLAVPSVPTELAVDDGFTFEERVLFGEVALTMMGLTRGFARLVLLCGHGSVTENNPYETAFDCGACGGHRGGPNARTAAAILNQPGVRAALTERGIQIPGDTVFVAGEHDTASDTVELLDRHLIPPSHRAELAQLERDLGAAGAANSHERCTQLPGAPADPRPAAAHRHVRARGRDWAEVFPEWGLAGNAAFIVGPRAMTRGLDLERRTFLHSYEAAVDRDGTALETILTAPLVVAQWISCQYYFSTVDPGVFGAGTKTIHNIVGAVGVLSGHAGDLRLGLPWQSIAVGEQLVHEPMRLLAVVQAPLELIDAIIGRNTILQHLFGHGWVALAAREHEDEGWRRRTRNGTWEPWFMREGVRR